ncbi:3'-N-debenzoyl-2'-deoxytaxol N-benzoyltransferase [Typha latifolia]|uniref:3'-N-debenzoyl-2'-deoxytaxol N-benzoyltransferase n=1 Tax=Typha latifolia TaxID=4733 RepID=UPI003C3089C9
MEEVDIIETILVSPSPPPVSHTLPLSHLDSDRNLHVTFRTLRLYSPNKSSDLEPFHVISSALPAALSLYYPLVGSVCPRPSDSRLEVRVCSGDAVPLTRATASFRLDRLDLERPGSPLLDRLAPDRDGLALQVTRFACGGFALGMCIHHATCDGAGATMFLSHVARLARGGASPAVEPIWERELLGPRRPPRVEISFDEVLRFDHDVASYGPYSKVGGGGDQLVVRECFHVSDACLERFREGLAEKAGMSFTTFEALAAFIWRARVKASGIESEETVKMVYSMNISKVLKPALPTGYWGNVCLPVYVNLTVTQLVEQPLWETASLIKKSKHGVTTEYVRSYIDFQEVHYAGGITAGERVSAFTDWRRLGHSELDFGWGGPITTLPLSWRLLGSRDPCFFLPYGAMDGRRSQGFKVLVCLPQKALHSFSLDMEMFGG